MSNPINTVTESNGLKVVTSPSSTISTSSTNHPSSSPNSLVPLHYSDNDYHKPRADGRYLYTDSYK